MQTTISSRWTFHSGRIGALAFSPNSKRLVSGGLDESIYLWSTEKQMKNIVIKVGLLQVPSTLLMIRLLSTGADGCVRSWTVAE
jgi:WD40 repeat protein